jgi:hypothetical protein
MVKVHDVGWEATTAVSTGCVFDLVQELASSHTTVSLAFSIGLPQFLPPLVLVGFLSLLDTLGVGSLPLLGAAARAAVAS